MKVFFLFFLVVEEEFFSKRTKRHTFISFQKETEPRFFFSQPPAPPCLRRVPTPSQPPSYIGGGLIDYGVAFVKVLVWLAEPLPLRGERWLFIPLPREGWGGA